MANAMKVADAANPKLAGASIAAVMVQKAGFAVGVATGSGYAEWGVAPPSRADDFIAAQVPAPETVGASELSAVLGGAANSYQFRCAFKISGMLVHSIPIQPGVPS